MHYYIVKKDLWRSQCIKKLCKVVLRCSRQIITSNAVFFLALILVDKHPWWSIFIKYHFLRFDLLTENRTCYSNASCSTELQLSCLQYKSLLIDRYLLHTLSCISKFPLCCCFFSVVWVIHFLWRFICY